MRKEEAAAATLVRLAVEGNRRLMAVVAWLATLPIFGRPRVHVTTRYGATSRVALRGRDGSFVQGSGRGPDRLACLAAVASVAPTHTCSLPTALFFMCRALPQHTMFAACNQAPLPAEAGCAVVRVPVTPRGLHPAVDRSPPTIGLVCVVSREWSLLPVGTVGRIVSVHKAGRANAAASRIDAMRMVRGGGGDDRSSRRCVVCRRGTLDCGFCDGSPASVLRRCRECDSRRAPWGVRVCSCYAGNKTVGELPAAQSRIELQGRGVVAPAIAPAISPEVPAEVPPPFAP